MSASNSDLINRLGDELHTAMAERRPLVPITDREQDLTIADAYRIQARMISHRIAAGERIVGKKVGATSRAVQQMLSVDQPDFGYLLSGMVYAEGEAVPMASLIQPLAEGEIAFFLRHDLPDSNVRPSDVLRATECVMPCFEIVDSRIKDWKLRIQDTVADNASCGAFVLGDRAIDPRKVDLRLTGMVIEKNGELACTGVGAAALGHPLNAVAWLANTMGALGSPLRAGDLVLSGALASMIKVKEGDSLRLSLGGIGQCTVRFS